MVLQLIPITTFAAAAPAPAPATSVTIPKTHQNKIHHHIESIESHQHHLVSNRNNHHIVTNNQKLIESENSSQLGNILNLSNSLESHLSSSIFRKKKHRIRSLESNEIPWHNPCVGGSFDSSVMQRKITVQSRRKAFKTLRDTIKVEKEGIYDYGSIVTTDFETWSKHAENYKFLPVVKPKANITLIKWHQQMQRYVGALSFLTKQLEKERKPNRPYISEMSKLFQKSRKVLCQIEKSINLTQMGVNIFERYYTKQQMSKYIEKLQTRRHSRIVSLIDLKYIKVYFNNTMKGMARALSKKMREMDCIIKERKHNSEPNVSMSEMSSKSISSSSSSSRQQDNYNNYFANLFDMNNNSDSNSENLSNNNSSNDYKRSKICQRILEKRKNKKTIPSLKNNKNNKVLRTGVVFG